MEVYFVSSAWGITFGAFWQIAQKFAKNKKLASLQMGRNRPISTYIYILAQKNAFVNLFSPKLNKK